MKHIVVGGNPIDGLTFEGPFDSREEAIAYAERAWDSDDWWIAPLAGPTDETGEPLK